MTQPAQWTGGVAGHHQQLAAAAMNPAKFEPYSVLLSDTTLVDMALTINHKKYIVKTDLRSILLFFPGYDENNFTDSMSDMIV